MELLEAASLALPSTVVGGVFSLKDVDGVNTGRLAETFGGWSRLDEVVGYVTAFPAEELSVE